MVEKLKEEIARMEEDMQSHYSDSQSVVSKA